MRLLHVTPHLMVGGAEKLVAQLSRIQQARPGWEVAVAGESGPVVDELAVPFLELPHESSKLARARALRTFLGGLVEEFQPDVVHTHALHVTAPQLGILGRRPVVMTLHNTLISRNLAGAAVAAFSRVHVAFVSAFAAERILPLIPPRRRSNVHVVPNGIDLDFWTRRSHTPASDSVVLWVGRLNPPKNPLEAVDVFEHVAKHRPSAHLIFAGDGPLRLELDRRVEASSAGNRIHLKGECKSDEVRDLFQQSSVLLNTSRREGLPLSLLEALAVGVVPVAPDLPTLRAAQLGGLQLYRQGDHGDAAAKIEQALERGLQFKPVVRSLVDCEGDYAYLYDRACSSARRAALELR